MKRVSTVLTIGALSGVSVSDFYAVCRRFNVTVISCSKIDGILNKRYAVTIEGSDINISRVASVFRG